MDAWFLEDFANIVDTLSAYLQRVSTHDRTRGLGVFHADSVAFLMLSAHLQAQAQASPKSVVFAASGFLGHG
jgi:hypothetical protein